MKNRKKKKTKQIARKRDTSRLTEMFDMWKRANVFPLKCFLVSPWQHFIKECWLFGDIQMYSHCQCIKWPFVTINVVCALSGEKWYFIQIFRLSYDRFYSNIENPKGYANKSFVFSIIWLLLHNCIDFKCFCCCYC